VARLSTCAPPLRVALALSGALFFVVLGFVVATAPLKLPNDVEGQLLYEASRIRRGLPLYVDPLAGAFDDGPLPIRKYVLYTPLWPLLTSLVPPPWALETWRVVAALAWFLGLLALAVWPEPGQPRPVLRPAALLAALCGGSLFLLARSGLEAKPDTICALICAWAFARTVRRGRLDAGSAVLFVIAALTKPNMIGIASGVILCDVVSRRTKSAFPLGLGAGVASAGALWFAWTSHGTWLAHLHASAMMPIGPSRWLAYLRDYAVWLGAPQTAVAALAWAASRRARTVPYGPAGLGTSIVWACFAMGKHGSGTAYWLEPTMAMVVVLAYGEPILLGQQRALLLGVRAAPLLPVVFGVMSVPYFLREYDTARRDETLVRDLRTACALGLGETVTASDTGLEMALSGRVTWAPWATTFLLRSGAFPLATIENDYGRQALACFVDRSCDSITPEPVPFDPGSEHSVFRFELRPTILANFQRVDRVSGACVFRRARAP
jgi:hypothetical protein